jgi:hypothetical protein
MWNIHRKVCQITLDNMSLEKKNDLDSPRVFPINLADTRFESFTGRSFSRRINPKQNPE